MPEKESQGMFSRPYAALAISLADAETSSSMEISGNVGSSGLVVLILTWPKQCDGGEPCGPCSVKNRECKPYSRGFIFVQHPASEGSGAGPSVSGDVSMIPPRYGSRGAVTAPEISLELHTKTFRLPRTLAQVTIAGHAYSDQLVGRFAESYASTVKESADMAQLPTFSWIPELPTLKGSNRALDMAILALSCAGLGREHQDLVLLRNATDAYGRALASLHNQLNQPSLVSQTKTLFTCLVLLMFQIIGDHPRKGEWMSHAKGIGELIRLRGPASYLTGIDHMLFRSCRHSIIIAALCSLQTTFLASKPWRRIPWTSISKTPYDALLDRMTLLPALLVRCAEVDQITGSRERSALRQQIITDCWLLEAEFLKWYGNLPSSTRTYGLVASSLQLEGTSGYPCPFPQSYEFPSLVAAHMHMMYWSSLLILYNILKLTLQALQAVETSYYWPAHPAALRCKRCYAAFNANPNDAKNGCQCGFMCSQPRFDVSHIRAPNATQDSVATAEKISRSISYCLQHSFKAMGLYYALFPLKMAIGTFTAHLPSTEAPLAWCYSVVELLERKGVQFSKKMLTAYEGRDLGGFAG